MVADELLAVVNEATELVAAFAGNCVVGGDNERRARDATRFLVASTDAD
jgi:hypothetical protein